MPSYSPIDLVNEVYIAILSMRNSFSTSELVDRINENRRKKGISRGVASSSVERILLKLWLPLGVGKNENGRWKKGISPIRGMINFQSEVVDRIIREAKVDATSFEIGKWIALGEEPTTHKAYICYPYRDNPFRRSMELLILLIYLYPKAKSNFVPATPHEMYWEMEERVDRETAMDKCASLIADCDFLLYCLKKTDEPSSGMKQDMEIARTLNPPKEVQYIEDLLGEYPDIAGIMMKVGLPEFTDAPQMLTVAPVNDNIKLETE